MGFTSVPNVTTNFLPSNGDGKWKMKQLPMIATVEIAEGAAVYYVGDGTVTKATNSSANFAGILAQPIAATDSDYGTSMKKKAVWVPQAIDAEAEFKVGSGTFTTADIGKSADFYDEVSVAVDTSSAKQVRITQYLSSTRGRCTFKQTIA